MADGATSTHAGVQAQLDRLAMLSPGRDVLGLSRISALLDALGNPERQLPPQFHVAGTNGKGSTCTFLRAMLEAQGYRVHLFTSPHLVRYNERIRVAGSLIEDEALSALLTEVLDASGDIQPSFFEVTTAVAMLAFARTHADACIFEVGLGGRLDATNILARPLVCGIAGLAIDHKEFLLAPDPDTPSDPFARIAFEKAGIAKAGTPLVTQNYSAPMEQAITDAAAKAGAPVVARDRDWFAETADGALQYRDAACTLSLPLPMLPGAHQADNAALAVAMLRFQDRLPVSVDAMASGIKSARWPARLQRLGAGPLTAHMPASEVWLDGGHNPHAAREIRRFLEDKGPVTLIFGLLSNKELDGYLAELRGLPLHIIAIPVPDHMSHNPDRIAKSAQDFGFTAQSAANAEDAVRLAQQAPVILIAGSLYLAGDVLRLNGEPPV